MTAQFQKNQCYTLTITGISNEGNGVGKIDGFTVFVPFTAVGDVIRVRLVKVLKHYAFGKVEELLTPSPDRIPADCGAYPKCGGCSLRQMSYESELQVKDQWVRDAFQRIGGLSPDFQPILGSESCEGYRNKAQYPFGVDAAGQVTAGFYGRHSHRVVDCPACALQPPVFSEILYAVREFVEHRNIPIYDEQTGKGLLRNLYLRRGEETGEVMVCLVATDAQIPHIGELDRLLREKFPNIASICVNVNKKNTNVILGDQYVFVSGKERITDRMCGVQVEISPASFYQVNHAQAQRLYRIAEEYAAFTGEEVLLDLYCGVGSIGLSMAERVSRLVGVEVVPSAVENARRNAQKSGIRNARFLCADAGAAAAQLAREGLRPDVVIVDPPRKGCSQDVLQAIVQMAPSRVVMISCNPSTAARDCASLRELGYQAETVRAVDLFPRTSHVECVVKLCQR